MSVKTILLNEPYTGKITVYRATGKGPVRYGDRYTVFLEACSEVAKGKQILVASITNEGRNTWRIVEKASDAKIANAGFYGTLEQAARAAASVTIENTRFLARETAEAGA